MNIPIRMIDLATAVCWVLLIILSASAVYSVKDVQFGLGELQTGMTPDGKILFSLPINISNEGYYDIGSFNFTTRILDQNDNQITEGSTLISTVRRGEKLSVFHNMTFDLNSLQQFDQKYLFNDTQLNATESVSMKLGEIIPVQASENFTILWGAPLYNFELGQPQYSMLNSTHMRVTVFLGFDNHAPIDIIGQAQICMFNSANQLIGLGKTEIKAAQRSHYDNYVGLYVETASVARTARLELEFKTPLFSYGPVVIPYG
jgi:hypothetical protein